MIKSTITDPGVRRLKWVSLESRTEKIESHHSDFDCFDHQDRSEYQLPTGQGYIFPFYLAGSNFLAICWVVCSHVPVLCPARLSGRLRVSARLLLAVATCSSSSPVSSVSSLPLSPESCHIVPCPRVPVSPCPRVPCVWCE